MDRATHAGDAVFREQKHLSALRFVVGDQILTNGVYLTQVGGYFVEVNAAAL